MCRVPQVSVPEGSANLGHPASLRGLVWSSRELQRSRELLVPSRPDLHHGQVAVTILVDAIDRILAHNPVDWVCVGLLEHDEVVISLKTSRLSTPCIVEVEQGIRVTAMVWSGTR